MHPLPLTPVTKGYYATNLASVAVRPLGSRTQVAQNAPSCEDFPRPCAEVAFVRAQFRHFPRISFFV